MISFDEARKIVNSNSILLPSEKLDIKNCIGRVLADDIISDVNMPPFDKSAMDGYAIRKEDLFNELEVVEIIKAGDIPQKRIGACQCSKIMTGAIVPEGADSVIIIEDTIAAGNKVRYTGKSTNTNIAFKAEDIKIGETVLKKGTVLRPQEIAILATVGCTQPLVYNLPRIAIMSTGDEIVEPYILPENGKIRNSNAYQLIAQVQNCGITPDYLGIIEDDEEITYNKIKNAIKNYDVLLLTGGISMGDYDFVPKVLQKAGVNILFQTVAMRPGKPSVFGRFNDTFIFCLPGNPVSSFIVFEVFAKNFIQRMSGNNQTFLFQKMLMGQEYKIRPTKRLSWAPVAIDENFNVSPVDYHGSAHIYALCFAKGIMMIPPETELIKKGEEVHVRQI